MKIVLSIDGGGIRGLVPITILDYLEKKIQKIQGDNRIKIANLIDFVVGTSTGTVIAALLLLPSETKNHAKYSAKDVQNLYFQIGKYIFKKNFKHNIKTLWGILGPQYPSSNLDSFILEYFNHYKISDLIKSCAFLGYDTYKRKIVVYTNLDKTKKYESYYIKDIIRASISIPSYYSPACFKDGTDIHTIIDGGIIAANPSKIAITEILKEEKTLEDIFLISLGAGKPSENFKRVYSYEKIKRWGISQWFVPLLEIIYSSSAESVDYEVDHLFKTYKVEKNYIRINPDLSYSSGFSTKILKGDTIKILKDVNLYIEKNKENLDQIAERICQIKYLIRSDE